MISRSRTAYISESVLYCCSIVVFLSDAPSGPCPGDREAEVHYLSGVGMDEAEPCALKRKVSLDAAAVFAVAPERVAAGRELHPYLVGAPGVEGDVREAGAASGAEAEMRYSSTASFTPLRGRLTGKTRPFRLSLNK